MRSAAIFFTFSLCLCTEWVQAQPFANTYTKFRMPYREGMMWGYCDTLAQVIFPPQYDSVGFYDVGGSWWAIFKKNGKLGLLDGRYKEVMPATTTVLKFSNGMNPKHQVYFLGNDEVTFGVDPDPMLMASGEVGSVGVKELYSNNLGVRKEIIPALYDDVDFYFSMAHYILVQKSGKWGAYKDNGEKICEPIYDEIFQSQRFPETFSLRKNGLVGSIGANYYFIEPRGEHLPLKAGTKPGYPKQPFDIPFSDSEKKSILKQEPAGKKAFQFQEIIWDKSEDISEPPYVLVRKGKKTAVWDYRQNRLMTDFYDDIFDIQVENQIVEIGAMEAAPSNREYSTLFFVKKGKKCGIVDQKGRVKAPFRYDGFGEITTAYYVTNIKNKLGITINNTIYPPIEPAYDYIDMILQTRVNNGWSFGVFQVRKNGRPGFIGENGKEYFTDK